METIVMHRWEVDNSESTPSLVDQITGDAEGADPLPYAQRLTSPQIAGLWMRKEWEEGGARHTVTMDGMGIAVPISLPSVYDHLRWQLLDPAYAADYIPFSDWYYAPGRLGSHTVTADGMTTSSLVFGFSVPFEPAVNLAEDPDIYGEAIPAPMLLGWSIYEAYSIADVGFFIGRQTGETAVNDFISVTGVSFDALTGLYTPDLDLPSASLEIENVMWIHQPIAPPA